MPIPVGYSQHRSGFFFKDDGSGPYSNRSGTAVLFGAGGGGGPTLSSSVGFGDSITFGVDASDAAHRWLNIVSAAYGAGTPLNQAISGTVLQNSPDSGGSPRVDNGRDRFAAALLGANIRDGLFLAYGFNDARYTGRPADFNVTQYAADYREVLSGLLEGGAYNPAKIWIISPYYITDTGLATGSAGFTGQTRAGFEAFVAAAASVAQSFGTRYVDMYQYMLANGGASLISADNIHPGDAGMAVIAAGVQTATVINTKAKPGISATSQTGGIGYTITVPASGTVTDYTVEYALVGSYNYGNSATVTSLTGTITLSPGSYRVRVRANFNDATSSPYVFSNVAVATAAGSVTFLNDTFTDTPGVILTAHTPEVGSTWIIQPNQSPQPASPSAINDTGDGLYSASVAGVYQNTAVAPSADYYVEAVLYWRSADTSANIGITGRAAPAANTYYFVRWQGSVNSWQLYKVVAGTATQLGSNVADTFTSGSKTVRLTMSGTTISVSVNGTQIISQTDAVITAAGAAGVRGGSAVTSSTGIQTASIMAVTL